ncbi:Clp protease N-terminal domain-containing protein [Conexibacter sp. JD483]|uniref:Clp protease N-terminal domain-containing protein n=1 Tax=unclassified Conexibacter TaxID=2627773 RepID=UPI00271EF2EB|nr:MULTISPECIES: Clp protease N-terminal domain-containing protein [unclassified Conexibacter]MDO8188026.1 Clp protease N-terminal domain-containing protein [Conexibacter sp. CPCC 205706]MDO8200909.1 Clp protease N-terminal domain-containing protein [Conexibacter sp. CPCC 205762]MDR9372723.1 Clp protease N-terminal domain-containing protein [Conexibacter sp. JD483]
MFERFAKDAAKVVHDAVEEAAALGSPTIEAEHLLLAIAGGRHGGATFLLEDAGLDADALMAALEREHELSLAAAGVAIGDFELPATPPRPRRTPSFATSSKRALERALKVAVANHSRRVGALHLLVGVLRAEFGTVPRALAGAEVDRIALATRAERMLG